MACGFEPGHVFPTDEDYQKVEGDEVREVLRRIFAISKSKKDYIVLMREVTYTYNTERFPYLGSLV